MGYSKRQAGCQDCQGYQGAHDAHDFSIFSRVLKVLKVLVRPGTLTFPIVLKVFTGTLIQWTVDNFESLEDL